jgi:hypothetical protein
MDLSKGHSPVAVVDRIMKKIPIFSRIRHEYHTLPSSHNDRVRTDRVQIPPMNSRIVLHKKYLTKFAVWLFTLGGSRLFHRPMHFVS